MVLFGVLFSLSFLLPIQDIFLSWLPFTFVAFSTIVFLVAILHIVAEATQSVALRTFVHMQWAEIFRLGGILLSFSAGLVVLNSLIITLIPSFLPSPSTYADYLSLARNGIDTMLGSCTGTSGTGYKGVFCSLVNANFKILKLSTFNYQGTFGIGFITWYGGNSPKAGMFVLNSAIAQALRDVERIIVILTIQKMLLEFFAFIFPLIFPFGIVFRFLRPTSKLGASLLAVGIGIYAIYPLGVIFEHLLANEYFGRAGISGNPTNPTNRLTLFSLIRTIDSVPDPGFPPNYSLICSEWMTLFTLVGEWGWYFIICIPACAGPCATGIGCAICLAKCKTFVFNWYVFVQSAFALNWYNQLRSYGAKDPMPYFNALYDVLPTLSFVSVVPLFLSFVNILFTVLFIRSLASTLGGEADLPGLMRVI